MQSRTQRYAAIGVRKNIAAFFSILLFVGMISGCMGSAAKRPAMTFYRLNYDSPVTGTQLQLPLILAVEPFQGVPPYDTTLIIYSTGRFAQNRYFYHRWIAEPAEMITRLFARDIRTANIFQAVVTSGDPAATHVLKGTVEGFYEQDTEDRWNAILSITVTLIAKTESGVTKGICFQKSYTKIQACEEKSPNGLAAAMSAAMSQVSGMIIADIREAVAFRTH